jgi:hypothetical protein
MATVEEFWAELNSLGEAEVRRKLILGDYRDMGAHRDAVLEWLRQKEVARQESRERRNMKWIRIGTIAAIIAAAAGVVVLADSATLRQLIGLSSR